MTLMSCERDVFAKYKDHQGWIVDRFHHCETCQAELFDKHDMKANRRVWLAFRKDVDGIPSGDQIRAMRHKANLNQRDAGELFGGGPVAFSKYENDELIPDGAMANLLRLAIAFPVTVSHLRMLKSSKRRIEFSHADHGTLEPVTSDEVQTVYERLSDSKISLGININGAQIELLKEPSWSLQ